MADQVSTVIYNGKKLIPAPFLGFQKQYKNAGDGTQIGTDLTVTLTGKMTAGKGWSFNGGAVSGLYGGSGYPADAENPCKFQNLLDMQEQLRNHFKVGEDYHWFEVSNPPHASKRWRARVKDINFKEGNWVEYFEYSIVLDLQSETQEDNYIQFSENWDIKFNEDGGNVYELTHTISCQSKQFANGESDIRDGYTKAKEWVKNKIGGSISDNTPEKDGKINQSIIYANTGFNLNSDYTAYNYNVQDTINHYDGTYSINESWILSKNPYIKKITVQVEDQKGGDIIIKLNGDFKAFINKDRDNPNTVKDAFDEWTANDSINVYNIANSYYNGKKILGSCPVNKNITYNKFSGGENENEISTETTRTISFAYEYSDGVSSSTDGYYEIETTISEKAQFTGDCVHIISIEGNVQGLSCGAKTPYENAKAGYNKKKEDILNLESARFYPYYTGTLTHSVNIKQISQSTNHNERKGNIAFSFEYSDLFTSGIKTVETITQSWSCDKRGSDGTQSKTISINGSIEGICGTEILPPDEDDIRTKLVDAEYLTGDTGYLVKRNISTDTFNNKINYEYEFDTDPGTAITTLNTTVKWGPDKCAIKYVNVQFDIIGKGCSNAIALDNAKAALPVARSLAAAKALEYSESAQYFISSSETYNDIGKISGSYEYSSEQGADVNINVVETQDINDCGFLKKNINGTIRGRCDGSTSALDSAEAAYDKINIVQTYFTPGNVISRSKTINEKEGSISFQFEGNTRDKNYTEEQNVTLSYSSDQVTRTARISGTITPICPAGCTSYSDCVDAQVAIGEQAWNSVAGTLVGLAKKALTGAPGCTQNPLLKSSSLTKGLLNGRISYEYEYVCNGCVSIQNVNGILEDSIDIQKKNRSKVIAQVPILGRIKGPVIQDKGTYTAEVYTITVGAKLAPSCTSITLLPPNMTDATGNLIISLLPSYTERYYHKIDDVETWNPKTGRYSRACTYVREYC